MLPSLGGVPCSRAPQDINRTAVEHWLQTIKARTGNFNCPVLLVGTHADEVPNREALEKELSEKWMAVYRQAGFVHIQGMAFVSCKVRPISRCWRRVSVCVNCAA